jgi:hypothetical protein
MTRSEPKFKPGDRVFSHYLMKWGTVLSEHRTVRDQVHGVTGGKLPDTTWYEVQVDGAELMRPELLDDAHGDWEMARIVPPHIAERYGYGPDPKVAA